MAEELAFEEPLGKGRAVDPDEGAILAIRLEVYLLGEELLAHAALPEDQDGGTGLGHALDELELFKDDGALGYKAVPAPALLDLGPAGSDLVLGLLEVTGVLDGDGRLDSEELKPLQVVLREVLLVALVEDLDDAYRLVADAHGYGEDGMVVVTDGFRYVGVETVVRFHVVHDERLPMEGYPAGYALPGIEREVLYFRPFGAEGDLEVELPRFLVPEDKGGRFALGQPRGRFKYLCQQGRGVPVVRVDESAYLDERPELDGGR